MTVRKRWLPKVMTALIGAVALVGVLLLTRLGPAVLRHTLGPERVVGEVHRLLSLEAPPAPATPELFDFLVALWQRKREIPLPWFAYLYTTHYVDSVRRRLPGTPTPTRAEMDDEITRNVEFFSIRARPTPTPAAD